MSIESAPSSISTNFSPEVNSPSFSPGISNEAGFNFNPSMGGMIDLKIETYTQPFETSPTQILDLPQDFSYPEYDLDPDSNIFDLPKFEFQVEKFIEEIDLPQNLAADLEIPIPQKFDAIEKAADTLAIEDTIAQIQTNPDLSIEEQAIWAPKFEKLLEEKTAQTNEEPADFAPVTRIDVLTSDQVDEEPEREARPIEDSEAAPIIHSFELLDFNHHAQENETDTQLPATVTEDVAKDEIEYESDVTATEDSKDNLTGLTTNAETGVLPQIKAEPQPVAQTDESQAAIVDQTETQTESQQSIDAYQESEAILDSGEDDLPPVDTDDIRTDEEDEPEEEQDEIEPEWEVWEINRTKQVAGDSLKRRLELSSKIIHESSHKHLVPIKDMVEGQVYKLDIANPQDVIENVDLPPVAHFAEVGLSKIGEDAEAAVVHKALTDAVTSALPTKITKIAKPKGIVKESQLEHGAQALAASGAKHIYHDAKRGYFAQESATRTHPWEADKEAA